MADVASAVDGFTEASSALGDEQRLAALRRSRILDTRSEPEYDRLAEVALAATGASIAKLSFVTDERQFTKALVADRGAAAGCRDEDVSSPLCRYVVASGTPLVVSDAATDPRGFADSGVRAYLGAPVVDPDGHVLGSLCVYELEAREWSPADLTIVSRLAEAASAVLDARARARALAATEERLRSLLDGVSAVLWEADAETWASQMVSEEAERLLGYPAEAWYGGPEFWMSLLHPDDRERVVTESRAAIARGDRHETEYRMIAADGRIVWVRDLVEVIPDESGAADTLRGVIVDITEAKVAALERQQAAERYRALVEHSPICSYIQNGENFRVTYMSPHVEVMLGVTAEEWIERGTALFHELLHPDDLAVVAAEVARCREDGAEFQMEYRLVARDGRVVWCYDATVPVLDTDGAVAFRQGFLVDITEIKHAHEALRQSELRHRTLLDHTTDLIAVIDDAGRYQFASKSHEQQLGYDAAQLIGEQSITRIHADDAPIAAAAVSAALDGDPPREVRIRLRDAEGSWRCIEGIAQRLESEPRPRAMLIGRDITAQVEAERASEHYARQLQLLAQASVQMTLPRTLAEITERAADLAREIVGVHASVATVVRGGDWQGASPVPSLSDKYAHWQEYDAPLTGKGLYRAIVDGNEPLRLTQDELEERRLTTRNGATPEHPPFRGLLGAPLIAANGDNLGLILLTDKVDGTEFTATDEAILVQLAQAMSAAVERALLEEQLRQSQKLEAIGQLAGGVAHDFNNLLTAIGGYTAFAMSATDPEEAHASLREVAAATDRAAALTRQLLMFSRKHVAKPQVIRLEDEVASITPMLRRIIGETVEIDCRFEASTAPVHADAQLVGQILLNLATNARDAMPEGGTLTIATAGVTGAVADLPSGRYTCLAVTDTGVGMDEATIARATEPFFTTKEPGSGTGLGLATVHGIVAESGGALVIESTPGSGTCVRAYFPAVDRDVRDEPAEAASMQTALPTAPTARVLLVEDEGVVRDLVATMLRRAGYHVVDTASPHEALVLAREQRFDALVTDVVMPEMTGPQLVQELGEQAPAVLFTSGYTGRDRIRHGIDEGVAFLQKPFTRDDLVSSLQALLA